jgi:hypothetical protein
MIKMQGRWAKSAHLRSANHPLYILALAHRIGPKPCSAEFSRTNFYEKALLVKPTWRLLSVAECNGFFFSALRTLLCFYPHFQ